MKIRLAENFRAVFYAPFYATHALGFFAREGLEVEFVTSAAPGDAIGGLDDGKIDLTWGGPMRVMKARDQNPNSTLVCFAEVVARDPFYLVGRADMGEFRLVDLGSLRFASVAEVPTPWMCLQHDLRLAGVDPTRLARIADRSMAENLEALRDGRLDVAQMFEPFVARALDQGFGKILYAASARGPCVYTSLLASRERIARDPTLFAAAIRAVGHMQEWLAARGAFELPAAVATYFTDVPPAVLAAALLRYGEAGIWAATPEMSRAGFLRLGESLMSGGFLSRPPSYEACVQEGLG